MLAPGVQLMRGQDRRTVAAERSSTRPSAMSCRASSSPSHGERRRPRVSGRSQARRTPCIATAGGKTARGAAARGVGEAIPALGAKPPGPLADDGPLDANRLGRVGVGLASRQPQADLPPTCQSGGDGGRALPAFQGLALFRGQDHASGRRAAACQGTLLRSMRWGHRKGYRHVASQSSQCGYRFMMSCT